MFNVKLKRLAAVATSLLYILYVYTAVSLATFLISRAPPPIVVLYTHHISTF